eukprot:155319-Pelagomonas_calceolata.AAC.1
MPAVWGQAPRFASMCTSRKRGQFLLWFVCMPQTPAFEDSPVHLGIPWSKRLTPFAQAHEPVVSPHCAAKFCTSAALQSKSSATGLVAQSGTEHAGYTQKQSMMRALSSRANSGQGKGVRGLRISSSFGLRNTQPCSMMGFREATDQQFCSVLSFIINH